MSVSSAMQDGDPLVINHERLLHLPPAHIKIQETNESTPRERDKKCQQKTTEREWILTVCKCHIDGRDKGKEYCMEENILGFDNAQFNAGWKRKCVLMSDWLCGGKYPLTIAAGAGPARGWCDEHPPRPAYPD